MSENETNDSIELYIVQVDRLLPYSTERKVPVLQGLRQDVTDAMRDTPEADPSTVFGLPRDVAKNLAMSQDWGTERAGWGIRTLAWVIDGIIRGFFFLVYFLGGLFFSISLFVPIEDFLQPIFDAISEIKWFEFGPANTIDLSYLFTPGEIVFLIVVFLFLLVTGILVAAGYNIALERYFSTTIGKKLLKLKVVDVSGIRITWQQALIRNLTKTVSDGFLFFDLILGMVLEKQDPDKAHKQRGMDILAETIVVKQN